MHIHYSGPDIDSIYAAIDQETEFMDKTHDDGFISKLFLTIGARQGHFNGAFVYGTDYDLFEQDTKDAKTLEVRAFESTTNPFIFLARLHVTQYLLNHIAQNPYLSLAESTFENMPMPLKQMYWFLTSRENPNRYGFKRDLVFQKLFNKRLQATRNG